MKLHHSMDSIHYFGANAVVSNGPRSYVLNAIHISALMRLAALNGARPEVLRSEISKLLPEEDSDLASSVMEAILPLTSTSRQDTLYRESGVPNWYFPETLSFYLARECPQRCLHCFRNSAPRTATFLPFSSVARMLRETAGKIPHVTFTGGDPLTHPQIKELIAIAVDRADLTVMTSLATPEPPLEQLKTVALLSVGVYGDSQESHDAFTNTPGAYKKVWNNLREAVSAGVPLRITHCLQADRLEMVRGIIESAISIGVREVQIGVISAVGRAKGAQAIWNDPQSFDYGRFMQRLEADYGVHINIINDEEAEYYAGAGGGCGAGVTLMDVDDDGWIFPCLFGGGRRNAIGHINQGASAFSRKIIPLPIVPPRPASEEPGCSEYCGAFCLRKELQ